MLALGLPGILGTDVFFMLERALDGTLVLEFGRGVRGLVDPPDAIVARGSRGVRIFGGVGGLPVDGFSDVSIAADAFSRGLRNMTISGREKRTYLPRTKDPV